MSIEEMKNVDVRTVDRDRLVDINEIEIDDSLPPKERAAEFSGRSRIHTASE